MARKEPGQGRTMPCRLGSGHVAKREWRVGGKRHCSTQQGPRLQGHGKDLAAEGSSMLQLVCTHILSERNLLVSTKSGHRYLERLQVHLMSGYGGYQMQDWGWTGYCLLARPLARQWSAHDMLPDSFLLLHIQVLHSCFPVYRRTMEYSTASKPFFHRNTRASGHVCVTE